MNEAGTSHAALGPEQRLPLMQTPYLQVLEGLLRNEFFLLVPLHSIHDAGPQQAYHGCFREVIPLHFFFHIEHHLHVTEKGGVRITGRWGVSAHRPGEGKVWANILLSPSLPGTYCQIITGTENTMFCFQSRSIFSPKIDRPGSGQELLDSGEQESISASRRDAFPCRGLQGPSRAGFP